MRSITNIGLMLTVVLMLSFKDDHYNHRGIINNKADDPATGFVVISVDGFNLAGNKGLHFYYHDSLAYGHNVVIAAKETNLLLNAPTLLLEASNKQTPFLILPGEKINIKYAGSDSVQMFVQGNQQRTNELNFFRKLVQKTGNVYYGFTLMPYLKKVNTLTDMYALEKIISDKKNARLQFLSSFSRQNPVSDSFTKIAVNVIKSTALTDTLLLYYNNGILLNRQNTYKKLIAEKLTTVKNIGFMPFQFYFRACNTLISMALTNDPDHILISSNDFAKRFDFTEAHFSGLTKDFLLSNTIYAAYSNSISISEQYLHKFNSECSDGGYKKIINERLNEKQAFINLKGTNNLLYADGKTTQDIQSVISKYKGKIALLDFWASWCSPCREEMPYLNVLKKAYKGKDIIFVSISKDSNTDSWITANKEEALGNDNTFLLLNAGKSPFMKRYNINTIPRYMLIGKDGKVISDDSPRPSDPKLKKLIDKYLD